MKILHTIQVDAQNTNTEGEHSYLVALSVGGLMECPEITYQDYQIIYADSEEEACKKYNVLNNCDYFYGHVIKQLY